MRGPADVPSPLGRTRACGSWGSARVAALPRGEDPPNSVANGSGEWILALPAPFLLLLRRAGSWMVPVSARGEGCVRGLAVPRVLGFKGSAESLGVQPGLCGALGATARSPGPVSVLRCGHCGSVSARTGARR